MSPDTCTRLNGQSFFRNLKFQSINFTLKLALITLFNQETSFDQFFTGRCLIDRFR